MTGVRPTATPLPPPALPREPKTITVNAAKALSGLGSTTIFKLIKSGRLASVRVEGRRLILYSSLMRLLTPDTDAAA